MPTGEKTLTKAALFQKVNKLEKFKYTHSKKGQALLQRNRKINDSHCGAPALPVYCATKSDIHSTSVSLFFLFFWPVFFLTKKEYFTSFWNIT